MQSNIRTKLRVSIPIILQIFFEIFLISLLQFLVSADCSFFFLCELSVGSSCTCFCEVFVQWEFRLCSVGYLLLCARWGTDALWRIFSALQVEPLQSSFSVAALLGDKLLQKTNNTGISMKKDDDASSRPGLPPTPQPSDSEEDEPLRKRRCTEQCELVKVNTVLSRERFLRILNTGKTISFLIFFSARNRLATPMHVHACAYRREVVLQDDPVRSVHSLLHHFCHLSFELTFYTLGWYQS